MHSKEDQQARSVQKEKVWMLLAKNLCMYMLAFHETCTCTSMTQGWFYAHINTLTTLFFCREGEQRQNRTKTKKEGETKEALKHHKDIQSCYCSRKSHISRQPDFFEQRSACIT